MVILADPCLWEVKGKTWRKQGVKWLRKKDESEYFVSLAFKRCITSLNFGFLICDKGIIIMFSVVKCILVFIKIFIECHLFVRELTFTQAALLLSII